MLIGTTQVCGELPYTSHLLSHLMSEQLHPMLHQTDPLPSLRSSHRKSGSSTN